MESTRREFLVACGCATATAAVGSAQQTATAGSWPMFGGNVANTGYSPDTVGPVSDIGPEWRFSTEGRVTASIAVSGDSLYVSSRDGNVYALNADGTEQWRFETGDVVRSSPAVVDGTVYVGSLDGNVYALDTDPDWEVGSSANEDEQWRFETDDGIISSPAVTDGRLYIGSRDNNLYALNAATGDEQWRFETGFSVESSPAIADNTVYVGSHDQNVYAIDTDPDWEVGAATEADELWRFTTGDTVPSSPAVSNGTVYVGSLDGNLYALDTVSGSVNWRFDTGGAVTASPAVESNDGTDDTVYIGSRNQSVYAIGAQNAERLWEFDTGQPVTSSPTVAGEAADDGVVYIGSSNFNVYGLDTTDGERLWEFDTGDRVRGSPAVVNVGTENDSADGIVYIGSRNGTVFALREGGESPVTTTPASPGGGSVPGGGGGGLRPLGDYTFVLLPVAVFMFLGVLFGSLYAAIRAGLFNRLGPDKDELPAYKDEQTSDAESDGSQHEAALPIWEAAIGDVINRADEQRKTATKDMVVTKHVDGDTLDSPVVAYEIESVRSEPARIQVTEPLLDGADPADMESQPLGEGWTVSNDKLVFEDTIEPGETVKTLIGRRDSEPDNVDELLSRPDIEVEE